MRPSGEDTDPDGGHDAADGIAPVDHATLARFLADHGEAAVFRVTHAADGESRQTLCWDVTVVGVSSAMQPGDATIWCTPLDPSSERFQLSIESLERVERTDPPPADFTRGANDATERAVGLRRLSVVDPGAVHVPQIIAMLEREDSNPTLEANAVRALRRGAVAEPQRWRPAVPLLRSFLERDAGGYPGETLRALRAIGEASPGDIAPALPAIRPYLDATETRRWCEAVRCVAAIAREFPADILDLVPTLADVVAEGGACRGPAVVALCQVAMDHPAAIEPATEPLAATIRDEAVSDTVRRDALATLGRLVGEQPSVGLDVVDAAASLLDADDFKLRNNAVAMLSEVAKIHTDAVEPYAAAIEPLLTAADTYTRVNASATLSRIAQDFPETVAHLRPVFEELRHDENGTVRQNAQCAIEYLDGAASTGCIEPPG